MLYLITDIVNIIMLYDEYKTYTLILFNVIIRADMLLKMTYKV